MTRRALALALAVAFPAAAQPVHPPHHHAPVPAPQAPAPETLPGLSVPDVPLVDQTGRPVRFYGDLVRGRVVAINFVFTSCTTVCLPMGATFGKLRALLGERAGREVELISVSVDPTIDTPARLAAWSERFGAGRGWTLVTGQPAQIVRLLKALGAYTPDLASHTPLVLVGNERAGRWTRVSGLAPPARLAALIAEVAAAPLPAAHSLAAEGRHPYFEDTPLLDQEGRERRFYSDLLRGKTVVIDAFFADCTGACPVMSRTFALLQERLSERLGRDLHLLSISVDPEKDSPARLKEHAARFGARPGWFFLTGRRGDVEAVVRKLGLAGERREAHANVFLIGNDRTGLWKKAFGLASPEEILPIVESVLDDPGEEPGPQS